MTARYDRSHLQASLMRHRPKGRPAVIDPPQSPPREQGTAQEAKERFGSMAVDRDVLAYVCYTPEQGTSVCRPELGRNMPLGDSRLLDRSRRFTAVVDPMR